MAFNIQDLKFLRQQSRLIDTFRWCATIGNLELAPNIKEFLSAYFIFKAFGCEVFHSIDLDINATINYDLNHPINSGMHEKFNVVWDGGTLEHIFNFPVAMANLMNLVAKDGHLIISTVANNFCGHGFYQFSPELFFKCLSINNGFSVLRMVAFRMGPFPRWKEITRNQILNHRIELCSIFPLHLIIHAQKLDCVNVKLGDIQQTNYEVMWNMSTNKVERPSKFKQALNLLRNYF